MSETSDLKKAILRQTVAENLALLEGTRLARERQAKAQRRRWSYALLLIVPVALAGSLFFLFWPNALAGSLVRPVALAGSDATAKATPVAAAELPETQRERSAGTPPLLVEAPARIDPTIFPLQVRRIVLDPGHGGGDLGTTNGELLEKNLTLDIAQRLRTLLEEAAFEVTMTREDDRTLVLKERGDYANTWNADLFVSIHINWIAERHIRGVETYFLGPAKDPELAALARRENQHSGYSLADQNSLIRSVLLNAQHDRSQTFAASVQRALFRSLRGYRPGLRNRGVKTAPFVVLVATEMPAILAEVSCLSNPEEAELLGRPLYRDHIAEALFSGIRGYARDVDQSEEKGS